MGAIARVLEARSTASEGSKSVASDYREREEELTGLADEEIWRAGKTVRALRPEAADRVRP